MSQAKIDKIWECYWHKEYLQALSLCDTALKNSADDQSILLVKARCSIQLDDFDAAELILNSLLRKFPNSAAVYETLALLESKRENLELSGTHLAESLRLDPQNALAHLNRGHNHRKIGKLDDALADYADAIRFDPKLAIAYYNEGIVFDKKGEREAALRDYSEAIRLDPGLMGAYQKRAWIEYGKDQLDLAHLDTQMAIQLKPNSNHHYLLGLIYSKQGHDDLAIQNFSKALDLDKNNLNALWHRACTYVLLKDYERSAIDFAHYYEKKPKGRYVDNTKKPKDFNPMYEAIHTHFEKVLKTQIANTAEHLIDYQPCYYLWNTSTKIVTRDGTSHHEYFGTFGTGYICFTDQNVRLVSLGSISEQYPVISKGFLNFLLSYDYRKPLKTDQLWVVPNKTISGAQISDNYINLVTPAMQWNIYEHFEKEMPRLQAMLNMAATGKMASIWSTPTGAHHLSLDPAKVIQLLRDLEELKRAGLLTSEEFEAKKNTLLAQI